MIYVFGMRNQLPSLLEIVGKYECIEENLMILY